MSDQRVSIFASFVPKPGHEADVERILRGMLKPTREEPGCRRYDLFRDRDDAAGFHLFEIYDDFAAVEHHRTTEHYKAYRASIEAHLASPIQAVLMNTIDMRAE